MVRQDGKLELFLIGKRSISYEDVSLFLLQFSAMAEGKEII